MLGYYLRLALTSLRRNPVLSALMVIAIGLGIGTSITTLTVLRLLSGDPLPQKSAVLFYPQLDPGNAPAPGVAMTHDEPHSQLSYIDAMNLLQARRADRQAAMVAGVVYVRPDTTIKGSEAAMRAFLTTARETTADFFALFATPFLHGGPWTAADDESRARLVVISKALNERLYGGGNSVGKTLRVKNTDFRIVGVIDAWRPVPRFYDIGDRQSYGQTEEVYLPLLTARELHFAIDGSINCWANDADVDHLETAPCTWLQFWVELDSPAKVQAYKAFLTQYSLDQKALGRFQRSPNVRLRSLMEWLDFKKAVPGDVRLQAWLAFGFLVVCLVNTVGLLLAKFLRRAPEIGVRRALGASRRDIFAQFLMEAAAIGVVGGLLGLLLTLGGLWAVRQQPAAYADLAHLDITMFIATFALAVIASVLAGLLPAWRACGVPPALQLKAN
jgi:putative ABC transport system permease protein